MPSSYVDKVFNPFLNSNVEKTFFKHRYCVFSYNFITKHTKINCHVLCNTFSHELFIYMYLPLNSMNLHKLFTDSNRCSHNTKYSFIIHHVNFFIIQFSSLNFLRVVSKKYLQISILHRKPFFFGNLISIYHLNSN